MVEFCQGQPWRKIRFARELDALREIRRIRKSGYRDQMRGGRERTAYYCVYCKGWHITRRSKRESQAIRDRRKSAGHSA